MAGWLYLAVMEEASGSSNRKCLLSHSKDEKTEDAAVGPPLATAWKKECSSTADGREALPSVACVACQRSQRRQAAPALWSVLCSKSSDV